MNYKFYIKVRDESEREHKVMVLVAESGATEPLGRDGRFNSTGRFVSDDDPCVAFGLKSRPRPTIGDRIVYTTQEERRSGGVWWGSHVNFDEIYRRATGHELKDDIAKWKNTGQPLALDLDGDLLYL